MILKILIIFYFFCVNNFQKSVKKLKQLLSKGSVVKSLDKNTEDRQAGHGGNRLITWNDIFKV